jgi:hypothetical protein
MGTFTRSLPVPYRMILRWAAGIERHGLLRSMPRSRATARTMSVPQLVPSPTAPRGLTAPSLTDRSGLGTASSGSISMRVPRPEHSGHIPSGELNENSCGDGSGNEIPHSWQARCCDMTFSVWPSGATITMPPP